MDTTPNTFLLHVLLLLQEDPVMRAPVVASRQSMVSWERGFAASGRSSGPLNQYWKATLPESMLALEPTFATLQRSRLTGQSAGVQDPRG